MFMFQSYFMGLLFLQNRLALFSIVICHLKTFVFQTVNRQRCQLLCCFVLFVLCNCSIITNYPSPKHHTKVKHINRRQIIHNMVLNHPNQHLRRRSSDEDYQNRNNRGTENEESKLLSFIKKNWITAACIGLFIAGLILVAGYHSGYIGRVLQGKGSMAVHIRDDAGKVHVIEVAGDAIVGDVWTAAQAAGLIPAGRNRISFQGTALDPGQLLSDAGVCSECELHMVTIPGFNTQNGVALSDDGTIAKYDLKEGQVISVSPSFDLMEQSNDQVRQVTFKVMDLAKGEIEFVIQTKDKESSDLRQFVYSWWDEAGVGRVATYKNGRPSGGNFRGIQTHDETQEDDEVTVEVDASARTVTLSRIDSGDHQNKVIVNKWPIGDWPREAAYEFGFRIIDGQGTVKIM